MVSFASNHALKSAYRMVCYIWLNFRRISFPSGHASMSIYFLLYGVLHLAELQKDILPISPNCFNVSLSHGVLHLAELIIRRISFPSGHASMSIYFLLYGVLHLAELQKDILPIRPCFNVILFFIAWCVAFG